MLGHAGLMIKAIGLPGYGRREGHGQPVLELGILAYDLDAQGMRIKRLHSLETFSAQVQPAACSVRLRLRPQVLVDPLQAPAIGTPAHPQTRRPSCRERGGQYVETT